MNNNILKSGPQEFIENNWNADSLSVLLKKPIFSGVSQKELAEQLEAKKKCWRKLPTWFTTRTIYYPPKLHIEQSSSEQTAAYKAKLISGKTVLDLTGGLGVDSFYFSKKISQVFHCEVNTNLSKIACHNFNVLGAKNISCHSGDGMYFLENSKERFDWVYIDPSRRNGVKGKVFLLSDCMPDVPKYLNSIFDKSDTILLKTSPLLDIKQGISELEYVKELHIVGIKNEVKELLWVLKKGFLGKIEIKTINLKETGNEAFNFQLDEEKETNAILGLPLDYLYEPNATILKAGAFKIIGKHFGLKKLHNHSHLYTSGELVGFPGRRFFIENVLPYTKKTWQQLRLTKANITTRNFPLSVSVLRKQLKIKEGGDDYLFFTTDLNERRIIIHCKRKP